MSAALSANTLVKMDDEEAPLWARDKAGKTRVLLGGNLFGIILVAAMVFGIYHMTWWIPVICLFVTFPAFHVIILERLLGPAKGLMFSGFVALGSIALMWMSW